ncbi:conserved hypothetical protein [Bradyrhizobium sp. ORS 375]|uniref:hypothetical protein n=1 Tax=Bradyrhizobium sp. (strain ORS 375) TaxID=566679 RepID=UPI0002405A0B|nr:hypothetical protein [Bradyrhizobium sp. ORS 375]CCD97061.1 conserved hypothetical protein [Bradyrhizobium sp. ORS 375]
MTVTDTLDERTMDVREFEDLVDRLGEDVSRWPAEQRQAADALLASSPEARRLIADARLVREALSSPPVRAPTGLTARILATASRMAAEDAPPASADAHQPG